MSIKNNKNEVAIIGIACWYPGARNPLELWENILARRRQFRRMPDCRLPLSDYFDPDPKVPDKTYGDQAAVIDGYEYDWVGNRIPKSTYEVTDIVHWLAVDVAMEAMRDAGYDKTTLPKERTGVLLGNTLTGEFTRSNSFRMRWPYVAKALRKTASALNLSPDFTRQFEQYLEECFKSPFPQVTEDTLAGGLSNTIAGRICNYLDLKGGGYTVDGACSSSLLAICRAADCLVHGDLDLAFAGGVDISIDTFEMIGFAKTGAITPDEMKVYDKNGKGFIPGEGCGFVVLKRLEDARADKNYVYAVIRGWGISSDGRGGITAPSSTGQSLALRRAYEKAGYHPRTVDFVEGHGTGTSVGDPIEVEGIMLADDSQIADQPIPERTKKKGLTSLKSIIGHTKAAAGIGGLIKATIAVNRRVLPPTAGITEPHPIFNEKAHHIYPIQFGEVRDPNSKLRAGVSAMGFGGINTHVTLESGDAPSPKLKSPLDERSLLASHQSTELFVLAAENVNQMIEQAQKLSSIARDISLAEMADLSADLAQKINPTHRFRAAMIASRPKELVDKLNQLTKMIAEGPLAPGETRVSPFKDIWIGNCLKNPRVAFLCSGQGAQQLNMGRMLVERHPWLRELVNQADAWVGEQNDRLLSEYIFRPTDQADAQQLAEWKRQLTETRIAQPAICLTSLLWSKKLARLGIEPSAVAGHSLGELTAFHLAGALNEKELLKLAALRGQAMSASSDQAGTMISLGCDVTAAQALASHVSGYWTIANINSPTQTVIAGEKIALQEILKQAKTKGIQAVELPVSNAFHSKFVHHSAQILREQAKLPEQYFSRGIQLYSGMTGDLVVDGIALRDHFAQQITNPVNFIALVKSIASVSDLVIEVGPGNILSNLTRAILEDSPLPCLPVESRSGADKDLNAILAAYFVYGGNIHWQALFEDRLIRTFILPSQRKFIVNPCERELRVPSLESKKVSLPMASPISFLGDLGIAPETLSQYLSQRGEFIKEIIQTDIKYFSKIPIEPSGEALALEQPTEQRESSASVEPAITEKTAVDLQSNLEHRIIELIAQKTGFPPETLTPDMYLLNDLNMESIKAGELIVNIAREYGVAGKVDPAKLAQSNIRQVASAIIAVKEGAAIDAGSVTPMQQLLANIEKSSGVKTWVRNFIMVPTPEPLTRQSEALLSGKKALILHEASDEQLAATIARSLEQHGSLAQRKTFFAEEGQLPSDFSIVIGILPRSSADEVSSERIMNSVARFHLLARIGLTQQPSDGPSARPLLMVIQFADGKFGLEKGPRTLEQAGALSFFASIHHERPNLNVRSIDFDDELPDEQIAQALIAELGSDAVFEVAGYDKNLNRYVPHPVLQNPYQYSKRNIEWDSTDVILVTGGARGITAQCAFEVARRTGAKMALIGSSSLPTSDSMSESQREIVATLDRYKQANLTCQYFACDITEEHQVTETLQAIEQQLGPITGVIFGAGMNRPQTVENVPLDAAQQEIAPKVIGTLNISRALDQKPPKLFVGLTSIIGVTGMPGNAWYAFSNEMMQLLLQRFQKDHPQTSTLAIAFSVWDEVGMGARMGSVHTLAAMGTSAIPVSEGIDRFVSLFFNDPNAQQVIVTARIGGLDNWRPQLPTPPVANNFLENVVLLFPGIEAVVKVHLNLDRHPYLIDHNYEGSYLFPAVFGLEAMAQTVALVTGRQQFKSVSLRHIQFDRPIIADPEHGTNILIHAIVEENDGEEQFEHVRVGISAEQSGFAYHHFSAEFQLPIDFELERKPVDCKRPTNGPLQINPQMDLYGRLLFQGPSFQRLRQFYALSTVYTECTARIRSLASDEAGQERYLLGDPYFRDSILQTGQVVAGRDKALPKSIERIEIYSVEPTEDEAIIIAELIERTDEHWLSNFTVTDKSGFMMERLRQCEFSILETLADEPTCEEMASPDPRDHQLLQKYITQSRQQLGLSFPTARIFNRPALHQLSRSERRKQIKPVLEEVVSDFIGKKSPGSGSAYRIKWSPDGKPRVELDLNLPVHLSISHDNRFCLASVAQTQVGCDVMEIDEKATEDWKALLGPTHEALFAQLINQEHPKYAGSRLWAAKEALFKAANGDNIELSFIKSIDKFALFSGKSNGSEFQVVTFPVFFTLGRERMLAFAWQKSSAPEGQPQTDNDPNVNLNLFKPNSGKQREELLREFGYDPQTFMMDADIDEETMSLIIRWPLTLREAANLSRGIYFSTYGEWLGMVRELGIQPINDKLLPQLATGKWGLVTNESEIEILGDWYPNDTIQVRLWIMPDDRMPDSSLQLYYDWQKVTPQSNYERLAFGYLRASFVEILGHGEVKVTQLPDYFQQFIQRMKRPAHSAKKLDKIPERLKNLALGKLLYQKPDGPVRGPLLHEKIFETSLLESNMVGNIYFSNYYKWQGTVRDNYFYQLLPAHYQQTYVNADLRCLRTRIDHLRDTMPFAKIVVRMYLNRLQENGCELGFEYYQQLPNGQEIKLAYGTHQAAWIDHSDPLAPKAIPFPEPILKALVAACEKY
ncbi:MAG: SDR family NAD(P)-dependent oxidoreductase [candidate division KSB1 bacterium]|nr:SDR family NAD(P)-dependent oxidoreductase [candidate division KSB1 bacterium]